VFLKPSYRFPSTMTPTKAAMPMQNQLYQDSWDTGTRIEFQMATALDNARNVTFWHRNPDRAAYGGFFINGPFNHFPDFIARLDNGTILMVETKGDNASNTDSSKKLRLGQQWAAMAGANYRYFMVFESTPIDRAMNLDQFATTLRMMV
jgi:type III restriction enzyme